MIDSMQIKHTPLPQIAMERDTHIPLEIIEEILLNLPAKSLRRFSSVSRSWKAVISDEEFTRHHKIRASLPGHERILLSHSPSFLMPATTLRPLSSTSWNHRSPFTCPIRNPKLVVSCSELWCVESWGRFFVLNPSTGTYKQIPPPLINPPWASNAANFSYGMGFDSVSDDYKILKLPKSQVYSYYKRTEVYSLRSDSWREVNEPYPMQRYPYRNGVAVSNALYWMNHDGTDISTVISFDLSTEKYVDVVQPPFGPRELGVLTVLRGKLCAYLNGKRRFVIWEMDGKSWSKIVDVDRGRRSILTPLCLYQNGWMLMKATDAKGNAKIFVVKYKEQRQILWRGCDYGSTTGLLYVESLVSPARY